MNNLLPPSFNTLKKLIATLFLVLFALPFCEVNILTKNLQPFAIRVKSPSIIDAKNTLQSTYGWSIQPFTKKTKKIHFKIKISSSQALLEATSPEFWNSGNIHSSQSIQVNKVSGKLTFKTKGNRFIKIDQVKAGFQIGSGSYHFEVKIIV